MGTGNVTETNLEDQISVTLREMALKKCTCTTSPQSSHATDGKCAIHALDFDAMARAVLELAEKHK
ncbi:MAG: hypothetical protein HQL66_13900 [Magnetococcales bacterium]|nr:hypothetical protein [Magnetococcales bacterium]